MTVKESGNHPSQIECVYPVLKVNNLLASIAYYTQVLGFKEDWAIDTMAQVSRENYGIMFNQSEQIQPQEVWIGVERLEPFYEEFGQAGAIISQEPTNHRWAYDMKVQDPDGHCLWFGAGPKSDQSYQD